MRAIGNLEEVGGEMAEPLTAAELAAMRKEAEDCISLIGECPTSWDYRYHEQIIRLCAEVERLQAECNRRAIHALLEADPDMAIYPEVSWQLLGLVLSECRAWVDGVRAEGRMLIERAREKKREAG